MPPAGIMRQLRLSLKKQQASPRQPTAWLLGSHVLRVTDGRRGMFEASGSTPATKAEHASQRHARAARAGHGPEQPLTRRCSRQSWRTPLQRGGGSGVDHYTCCCRCGQAAAARGCMAGGRATCDRARAAACTLAHGWLTAACVGSRRNHVAVIHVASVIIQVIKVTALGGKVAQERSSWIAGR